MLLTSFFRHYGHTLITASIFTPKELENVFDILRPLHKTSLTKILTWHIEELFVDEKNTKTKKALVKKFFKSLYQRAHISCNPAEYIGLSKNYPRRKTTFVHSEVENILIYLQQEARTSTIASLYNLEMARFILYAIATGQRRAELLSLRVRDICLQERTLIIEKSKKMSDRRVLCFDEFLKAYQQRVIIDMTENCETKKPDEPLFCFMTHSKPSALWCKIRERMKLRKDLHLHDLRRLYLRTAQKEGLSFSRIQFILGHTNAQSLLRYLEVDQCSLGEIVREERLQERLIHNAGDNSVEKLWKND